MGNTIATDTLNSAIASSISILNKSVQTCAGQSAQNQGISINQVCGQSANVVIENIVLGEYYQITTTCVQNAAASTTTQQSIQQIINQSASTISQALNLNPGSQDASTLTNMMTDLSTSIVNSFGQSCGGALTQSQSFNIYQSAQNCNADIFFINFNDFSKNMINCIQTTDTVTKATQSVKDFITQKSSATVEGIFGPVLFALLLVGAFFAASQGYLQPKNLVFILIAVFLIYGALAYSRSWIPFKNKTK